MSKTVSMIALIKMLLLYGWFAALSRSGQRLPAGLHRCDVQAAVGGMLGKMSRITQYERCSLLAVKNSHKTVGCFLHFINGPADDLQYRCGVKILLHHGRKHEGEQDARKFLAGELLSKCVWPDLFCPWSAPWSAHPGCAARSAASAACHRRYPAAQSQARGG